MECQVRKQLLEKFTFSLPGLFGGLLSVLMAGIATPASYDKYSAGMDEKRYRQDFYSIFKISLFSA